MSDITLEQFEAEATAFLDSNASLKAEEKKFVWGEGSDKVTLFDEKARTNELEELAKAQAWRQKKFDAGFGWITGPSAYGGRELSQRLRPSVVRAREQVRGAEPRLLRHRARHGRAHDPRPRQRHREGQVPDGAVARRHRRLPAVQRAGRGLRPRRRSRPSAERDGDEWIINGQKVWTSGAQYSDIGEIITRSDPDMPKHKGLTGFIVDMHAPGVEVRPLRQMTGGASFNEVFFTDVRVPDDHRLGDVNQGWTVALTTLMNERASIGAGGAGGSSMASTTRLIEMVRHYGLDEDPITRQALADLIIRTKVASYTNQRAMDKIKMGQLPGPEMSIAKLALTQNMTKTAEFVANVLGPRLVADSGEWGTYAWGQFVLGIPGMRIAGGSDEVMRNIVGERVLGLPKDAGIDSTTPFRDLKVGTQTK